MAIIKKDIDFLGWEDKKEYMINCFTDLNKPEHKGYLKENVINFDAWDAEEPGALYQVSFDYYNNYYIIGDYGTDYGAIMDDIADYLEGQGFTGHFLSDDEIEADEIHECEFLICGNHGLNLYTHGMLDIEKLIAFE